MFPDHGQKLQIKLIWIVIFRLNNIIFITGRFNSFSSSASIIKRFYNWLVSMQGRCHCEDKTKWVKQWGNMWLILIIWGFHYCEFAHSLESTCNLKIDTEGFFTDISFVDMHMLNVAKKLSFLMHTFLAEVK